MIQLHYERCNEDEGGGGPAKKKKIDKDQRDSINCRFTYLIYLCFIGLVSFPSSTNTNTYQDFVNRIYTFALALFL